MVRILSTPDFVKREKRLPGWYQEVVQRIIDQLRLSPNTGKPLSYPFQREKKFGSYRLYFLHDRKNDIILLITLSNKKSQQVAIDNIKKRIQYYFEIIRKYVNAQ